MDINKTYIIYNIVLLSYRVVGARRSIGWLTRVSTGQTNRRGRWSESDKKIKKGNNLTDFYQTVLTGRGGAGYIRCVCVGDSRQAVRMWWEA